MALHIHHVHASPFFCTNGRGPFIFIPRPGCNIAVTEKRSHGEPGTGSQPIYLLQQVISLICNLLSVVRTENGSAHDACVGGIVLYPHCFL